MIKVSAKEITDTHIIIANAWNYACMILDYEVVEEDAEPFAEQYSIMYSQLEKILQKVNQVFVGDVRTQLIVAASSSNESAHLKSLNISKKVATVFRKGELFEKEKIVKHFDWLQEELSQLQPVDRDDLIHKMVVEEQKAISNLAETREDPNAKTDIIAKPSLTLTDGEIKILEILKNASPNHMKKQPLSDESGLDKIHGAFNRWLKNLLEKELISNEGVGRGAKGYCITEKGQAYLACIHSQTK